MRDKLDPWSTAALLILAMGAFLAGVLLGVR